MAFQEFTGYCNICEKQTLLRRKGTNKIGGWRCSQCGSSPPRVLSFFNCGIIGIFIVFLIITYMLKFSEKNVVDKIDIPVSKNAQQSLKKKDKVVEKKKEKELPFHKFYQAFRHKNNRSQLRAVVPLGKYSKKELMDIAVNLTNLYYPKSAKTLVQFFDNSLCVSNWNDGTGLLKDSDWPHWLCRISVDTNSKGQLYARIFKLAQDEKTGLPRDDVFPIEIKKDIPWYQKKEEQMAEEYVKMNIPEKSAKEKIWHIKKINTLIYGVYLGENIDAIFRRFKSKPKIFHRNSSMYNNSNQLINNYLITNYNVGVKNFGFAISSYYNKVYCMHIFFKDTSKSNLFAILKVLRNRYGAEEDELFKDIEERYHFYTEIEGKKVSITLDRDSIFDKSLYVSYYYDDIFSILYKEMEKDKTNNIKNMLDGNLINSYSDTSTSYELNQKFKKEELTPTQRYYNFIEQRINIAENKRYKKRIMNDEYNERRKRRPKINGISIRERERRRRKASRIERGFW